MNRVSLNPCGKLNTTTGKNLHFNVLTDWSGDEGYSLGTFTDWDAKGKQILIAGWGGAGEVGEAIDLYHGQTNKFMGTILIEATFGGGAEGLAEIKQTVGNSIRFATLD